jgi:hypothetical protein
MTRRARPGPPSQVVVQRPMNYAYHAFELEALRRAVGVARVRFSERGFPEPPRGRDGCAMIVRRPGRPERRLYVSTADPPDLYPAWLDWADVYAKVNLDPARVPAGARARVVPLGPTFGFRSWSPLQLLRARFAPRGLAEGRSAWRAWRGTLRTWRDRAPLGAYVPRPGRDDECFFVATPWVKHAEVNAPRAAFMRVAAALPGVRFTGGFAPSSPAEAAEVPDGLLAERRYRHREWITATQRSLAVFNTPAVHDCLGWKLGEFLALGKAIVSLPLTRALPAPLRHGEHLHVVDGSEDEIRAALERLRDDRDYRRHLERGARGWFEEHLAPERMWTRLLHLADGGEAAAGGPGGTGSEELDVAEGEAPRRQ